MHPSVRQYVQQALTAAEVAGRRVLEVGAQDVNGSVRPDVERLGPAVYLGVDAAPGVRVDQVVDATRLYAAFGRDAWDVVLATELLEHASDWRGCLANMISVLRPGGLLLLTTRSPGFPYHAFPDDHWRFPVETLGRVLAEASLEQLDLIPDWQCPGVFCKARKPLGWSWPMATLRHLWAGIEIPRAPQPPTIPPSGGTERSIVMPEPLSDRPQVAALLRQLLAERENAVAYGQTGRVEAVDKQLAELGYQPDAHAETGVGPAETESATERATKPPEGRSTRPRRTAEAKPGAVVVGEAKPEQ